MRWALSSLLADLDAPAALIGQLTGLDTGDGIVELLAQLADLALCG